MRILIVSRGYPTDSYSLNGIFEFDQAKALAQAGNEVIFAAIDVRSIRRSRKWGFVSEFRDGAHIEGLNIPCGRIPKFILNKIREVALRRLYAKVIEKYGEVDIIHSHFIEIGYVATKVFKKSNIPLIHTEHYSGMNQDNLDDYYMNLGIKTYPNIDKLISVSGYLAYNIESKFNISSRVIPNIVDTSLFKYKFKEKKDDKLKFISVGNLTENKNMGDLIITFKSVLDRNKNVELYIYGEGPEKHKLKNMVRKYNVEDSIFIMGQVSRNIIANRMQESDCFVLASKSETFGVAYIEAMASGLPVIATRCGGPEDFVNEDNGVLISVDNQEELLGAIDFMMKNHSIYSKKGLSENIKLIYSPEYIAKILLKVYSEEIY